MTSRRRVAACAPLAVMGLAGCRAIALAPEAEEAEAVAWLFWAMLAVGAAVVLLVSALLLVAVARGRRAPRADSANDGNGGAGARDRDGIGMVVRGGVVLPVLVIVPLTVLTLVTAARITAGAEDALVVEVTGHQFWWDVRYPASGAVTANEIHLPAGRPATIQMRSEDVIHSFWVPPLAGKVDLVPGQRTELHITAPAAGRYRGVCAEFCGIQHAGMKVLVVVDEPATFDAWLARQASPALENSAAAGAEGLDVFLRAGCGTCHAVRGTPADGEQGPDLTHLADRSTLAAGVIPNTRGHLAGWITDPQSTKPGARMPPVPLEPSELQALLDYLERLE